MNQKLNKKLAFAALLIVLACGGLWWMLRGTSGGRGAPVDLADVAREPAQPSLERAPAELSPSAAPDAGARSMPLPRVETAPAEELPEEHQTFALENARWLDVTVVLTAGPPADDRPALIGFARKDHEAYEEWGAIHLGESLALDDSFASAVADEHDWARRPLSRSLRLPFPAESQEGLLFVQSRYLHLDPVQVDLSKTSALTLAPELGGYVTGRCTFPAGATAAPADIEIEFDGRAKEDGLRGFARPDSRDASVAADLSFELRALSARKKYAVQAKAEGFVGYFELSFEIAPGEHREVNVSFRTGAALSGVVRGEGQPLAGARVSAEVRGGMPWNEDVSVESDANGEFRLAGVPGGKVTLEAAKDGWREAQSETLAVVEGEELRGIELVLDPGQRIRGSVRWPDGAPVAEADVKVLKRNERWMQPLGETKSAGDGTFVLGGLEEEPVEVFASHASPTFHASQPGDHGGVPSWIATTPEVAPGTNGLVLTLQPPIQVAGRVRDDAGEPVKAFRIEARPAERPSNAPEEVTRSFDDAADGTFVLEVGLPGDWLFTARADEDERVSEGVTLAVPQGNAALELVMPRASAVSGLVVDPAGNPVEGASLRVSDDPEEQAFGFFGDGAGTSDAEGRFSLASVKTPSTLHAMHEDWAASEPFVLELAPGESRTDLVLALRVGARVTGEVFDAEGKPEAGQNVNCANGAMAAMSMGFGGGDSTRSDSSGRFVFEHVTPGKVTVSALPSEEELMAQLQGGADETAFLSMMSEMRTASVEVTDGGEAHVVLGAKPKRPVRVHGLVTVAGAPLAERQVLVLAEGGALFQGMKYAKTGTDGRYEVVLDRPGDYIFGVALREDMEGTGAPFYVEVPEATEFEQDLALPLGRISGRVLGPTGPAGGIPLRLVSAEGMIGLDDLSEAHRTSSAGDGAFAFENLRAGSYAVHAGSEFDGGASQSRFGQAIVDGIQVAQDRAVEGLVVRLELPGKLAGNVRDAAGSAVAGVAIFVRDSAGRAISVSDCVSDAAGRFTYAGVAPGTVTVSARSSKLVSPESAAVEVRAGETTQLDLTVAPGTFLRVALLDGDKEVRARLRVTDEAGRRVDDLFAMEDFGALFTEGFSSRERRVGPLAPGKYTLVATALDGKDAKKSVLVEAGQEERSVKLRLK